MLDFSKIDLLDYENFFETKNPDNFTLQGFNSYIYNNGGIENFFDKCLLIDWAIDDDGWWEIDSPSSILRTMYESNPDLFDEMEKNDDFKKKIFDTSHNNWDKECIDFFADLETGTTSQGPYEWPRTYVCYAYEIVNFKKNCLIAHDIYCTYEKYTISEKFYESFDNLKSDLDANFLTSNWGTDFIQTSFG